MFATKAAGGKSPPQTERTGMPMRRKVVLLAAAAALLLAGKLLCSATTGASNGSPSVIIWAWERPENLSFIDPHSASVAYYAGTLYLKDDSVFLRPRLQKLMLPEGTRAFPVYRVESRWTGGSPPLALVPAAVDAIAKQFSDHPSDTIQIDYDATELERPLYTAFLHRLRKTLPPGTCISITALASWCLDDRWLGAADADEAVAMLFSMGWARDEVLSLLKTRKLKVPEKIELSIGISANEAHTNKSLKQLGILDSSKKLYIFQSLPWTRSRVAAVMKEALDR